MSVVVASAILHLHVSISCLPLLLVVPLTSSTALFARYCLSSSTLSSTQAPTHMSLVDESKKNLSAELQVGPPCISHSPPTHSLTLSLTHCDFCVYYCRQSSRSQMRCWSLRASTRRSLCCSISRRNVAPTAISHP